MVLGGVLPIAIWVDGLLHRKPTIAQLHRFPAPNQRNIDVCCILYPSYKWLGLTPLTPAMAMCCPLHLLHLLRAGSAMGQWEFQDPNWLVVWNMFYFSHHIGNNSPN